MSIIKVDAGLFRIVHMCVSTEETRYYLNGVHIEPYEGGGALLVSTNGHRALIALDPEAECPHNAIVQLPKHALSICKRPKEVERRELVIDCQNAVATINNSSPPREPEGERHIEMVAASTANIIDGTFPDWRRIVPAAMSDTTLANAAAFNGNYVKAFGVISKELGAHFGSDGRAMQIALSDGGSPVVVRWGGIESVFGILMPMRADIRGHLPEFMKPAEFKQAAE
jgi:hypothetical protein